MGDLLYLLIWDWRLTSRLAHPPASTWLLSYSPVNGGWGRGRGRNGRNREQQTTLGSGQEAGWELTLGDEGCLAKAPSSLYFRLWWSWDKYPFPSS